ncbi:unnamed protein product [Protopolystoma xenopodis]|uniref:Uncharacterized protein n=1 Tax=Protopolystoma xenopodis TaxID=117903 RepID=A0A3S5ARP8_9PLAT|nr:unnamed protein product [Protopolystoma xenopodis]
MKRHLTPFASRCLYSCRSPSVAQPYTHTHTHTCTHTNACLSFRLVLLPHKLALTRRHVSSLCPLSELAEPRRPRLEEVDGAPPSSSDHGRREGGMYRKTCCPTVARSSSPGRDEGLSNRPRFVQETYKPLGGGALRRRPSRLSGFEAAAIEFGVDGG